MPYFLKSPPADDLTWGNASTITKIHQQITSDDHVCVIWMEDLANYQSIAKLIKSSGSPNAKAMVYIFINPLKHTANGLHWVRILVPTQGTTSAHIAASQRLNENALVSFSCVSWLIFIFQHISCIDIWSLGRWYCGESPCFRIHGTKYSHLSTSSVSCGDRYLFQTLRDSKRIYRRNGASTSYKSTFIRVLFRYFHSRKGGSFLIS